MKDLSSFSPRVFVEHKVQGYSLPIIESKKELTHDTVVAFENDRSAVGQLGKAQSLLSLASASVERLTGGRIPM